MVEILIALPVQAANPFVAFIALVAFFSAVQIEPKEGLR